MDRMSTLIAGFKYVEQLTFHGYFEFFDQWLIIGASYIETSLLYLIRDGHYPNGIKSIYNSNLIAHNWIPEMIYYPLS